MFDAVAFNLALDLLFQPLTLVMLVTGVTIGIVIGVLPGLGPPVALSLALPLPLRCPSCHRSSCCWRFIRPIWADQ